MLLLLHIGTNGVMKKVCEFLEISQLKVFQVYQNKYCLEQSLNGKTVKVSTKHIHILHLFTNITLHIKKHIFLQSLGNLSDPVLGNIWLGRPGKL